MANDRINVSVEAFEQAVSQFHSCMSELQNSYLQMTSAVFTLDTTWNGEASEAFKNQYNELFNNLKTSDATIESAVKDIQMVVAGHEEVNAEVGASFEAAADTTDPFAAG
ncbi:MAG: WXG100 family type VII secretion target [Clostridiales bacterium]|nr:WXG100 family type VII secretion target [Clostridiales bacterium]